MPFTTLAHTGRVLLVIGLLAAAPRASAQEPAPLDPRTCRPPGAASNAVVEIAPPFDGSFRPPAARRVTPGPRPTLPRDANAVAVTPAQPRRPYTVVFGDARGTPGRPDVRLGGSNITRAGATTDAFAALHRLANDPEAAIPQRLRVPTGLVVVGRHVELSDVTTFGLDLVVIADRISLRGLLDTRAVTLARQPAPGAPAGNVLLLARSAIDARAPALLTTGSASRGGAIAVYTPRVRAPWLPTGQGRAWQNVPSAGLEYLAGRLVPGEPLYAWAEAGYRGLSFAFAERDRGVFPQLAFLFGAAEKASLGGQGALAALARRQADKLDLELNHAGEPRWPAAAPARPRLDSALRELTLLSEVRFEYAQFNLLRALAEVNELQVSEVNRMLDQQAQLLRATHDEAHAEAMRAVDEFQIAARKLNVATRYVDNLRTTLADQEREAFDAWLRDAQRSCSWWDSIKSFIGSIFGFATGSFGSGADKLIAGVEAAYKVATTNPGGGARGYVLICGREWWPNTLYLDLDFRRLERADLPYYMGQALVARFETDAAARRLLAANARYRSLGEALLALGEERVAFRQTVASATAERERLLAQQQILCRIGIGVMDRAQHRAYLAAAAVDTAILPRTTAAAQAAAFTFDHNFIDLERGPLQLHMAALDLDARFADWLGRQEATIVEAPPLSRATDPGFDQVAENARHVVGIASSTVARSLGLSTLRIARVYVVVEGLPPGRVLPVRLRRLGPVVARERPAIARPSLPDVPGLRPAGGLPGAPRPAQEPMRDIVFEVSGGQAFVPRDVFPPELTLSTALSSAGVDSFVNVPLGEAVGARSFGLPPEGHFSLEPALDDACPTSPTDACRRALDDFRAITSVRLYFGVVGER